MRAQLFWLWFLSCSSKETRNHRLKRETLQYLAYNLQSENEFCIHFCSHFCSEAVFNTCCFQLMLCMWTPDRHLLPAFSCLGEAIQSFPLIQLAQQSKYLLIFKQKQTAQRERVGSRLCKQVLHILLMCYAATHQAFIENFPLALVGSRLTGWCQHCWGSRPG